MEQKNIGVILFGSGFLDGSEIRESVATLWALSTENAKVHCFAPDKAQVDVINCLKNEPMPNEKRNGLTEAARIARGDIQPLKNCKSAELDALIFPGGYGVAKNLCTFATEGSNGSVDPEVLKIIKEFHSQKKPIGAICIAPALLALALKDQKLELTVGSTGEASQEIEKLGHKHIICKASDCHVDPKNKIVSTPAYMLDTAPLHEIFIGIHKLTKEVIRLT